MVKPQSILLLAATCHAHMVMVWPYALRAKNNPYTPSGLIDYNMMAPLTSSPSNFPCKGYQANTPLVDTTMYEAGSTYNMTLEGTATHGGGSCQLSMSYDNGNTFKVIKSIIGGCPLQKTYNFKVPSYAPTGHALFAWSWQNYMGNREFYMNCAAVHVMSDTTSPDQFNALPNIWVANLAGVNNCNTDGPNGAENVVYPEPGPDVEYGGGMSSASPPTTGDCQVPVQARFAAEPSFSFDPETSTSAPAEASATEPVNQFDPIVTTTTSTAPLTTMTTFSTLTSTSTSIVFTFSSLSSSTTTVQTISPIQASTSSAVSSSSTVSLTDTVSSSPSTVTSPSSASSPSISSSTYSSSNASFSGPSSTVSTTTITQNCPATVFITLPPTSYIATYTTSATASACTGTAAICPCADAYACMAIGDCTWECMAVSTPTGPSFQTSIAQATTTPSSVATVVTSTAALTSAAATSAPPSVATSLPQPSPSVPAQPGYVDPAQLSSYLPCISDTFICTDPNTFYTCVTAPDLSTSYQFPRNVAAGMMCLPQLSPGFDNRQGNTPVGYHRDDQYVAARPYGSCPVDGAFQCTNGGLGFQVCDHGGWVDMGSVAPGTRCVNGQIVSA